MATRTCRRPSVHPCARTAPRRLYNIECWLLSSWHFFCCCCVKMRSPVWRPVAIEPTTVRSFVRLSVRRLFVERGALLLLLRRFIHIHTHRSKLGRCRRRRWFHTRWDSKQPDADREQQQQKTKKRLTFLLGTWHRAHRTNVSVTHLVICDESLPPSRR